MTEEWKPVVGYEGFYEVSDQGRVRTLGRVGEYLGRWGRIKMTFEAKLLKISRSTTGYSYLCLKRPNEKSIKYLVHRLVLAAFRGPNRLQTNHKDGDKSNNRIENLEYCTAAENLNHCINVLGKKRGEGNGMAKVTEDDVRAIRVDNRTLHEIAADYGISHAAVWYIQRRRNWKHVV